MSLDKKRDHELGITRIHMMMVDDLDAMCCIHMDFICELQYPSFHINNWGFKSPSRRHEGLIRRSTGQSCNGSQYFASSLPKNNLKSPINSIHLARCSSYHRR